MNKNIFSAAAKFTLITFLTTQLTGPVPAQAAGELISANIAQPAVQFDGSAQTASSFQLNIPAEFGTIEQLISGNGPALIHIQDAHGNYEAQKNIQAILHYLKDNYGFETILLEGASAELKPELIRFFPGRMDLTMKIAENLTRKAMVKGPELFLLEALETRGFGIENAESYRENGTAFKKVIQAREHTQQFVDQMNLQIERLTSPYLAKDLREILKRLEGFEAGIVPLNDWLTSLKKYAQKHLEMDLENAAYQLDWPMLVRLYKIQKFESKIDLQAFKNERDAFLEKVSSSLRGGRQADEATLDLPAGQAGIASTDRELSRNDGDFLYEEIANHLHAPLSGHKLPDPETGILFENMAGALGQDFDYEDYPNVTLFIGHLILQSELKGHLLMDEMDRMIEKITLKLAQSEKEKQILEVLKSYRLLKKLFRLELTPNDYLSLRGGRQADEAIPGTEIASTDRELSRNDNVDFYRPSILVQKFIALNDSKRVRNLEFEHMNSIDELYDAALDFYRTVKERDEWMLKNAERILADSVERVADRKAVVITGGFHAEPFRRYFAAKDYNYALISPKITTIDGRSTYLEAALQENPKTIQASTRMVTALPEPIKTRETLGVNTRFESRNIIESIAQEAGTDGAFLTEGILGPATVVSLKRSENRINVTLRANDLFGRQIQRSVPVPTRPRFHIPDDDDEDEVFERDEAVRSEARDESNIQVGGFKAIDLLNMPDMKFGSFSLGNGELRRELDGLVRTQDDFVAIALVPSRQEIKNSDHVRWVDLSDRLGRVEILVNDFMKLVSEMGAGNYRIQGALVAFEPGRQSPENKLMLVVMPETRGRGFTGSGPGAEKLFQRPLPSKPSIAEALRPSRAEELEKEEVEVSEPLPRSEVRALSLNRRVGEKIVIGDGQVGITLTEIMGNKVKIGIKADKELPVRRAEVPPQFSRKKKSFKDAMRQEITETSPPGLVLTRKKDEALIIGEIITVQVGEIRQGRVTLLIEAPKEVVIKRFEIYQPGQQPPRSEVRGRKVVEFTVGGEARELVEEEVKRYLEGVQRSQLSVKDVYLDNRRLNRDRLMEAALVPGQTIRITPTQLVFVAYEMTPFFGVGGLKDVMRELLPEFSKAYYDTSIILPAHSTISKSGVDISDTNKSFEVSVAGAEAVPFRILHAEFEGVQVYFLANDQHFQGGYLSGDEAIREAAIFSRAVPIALKVLRLDPDVVHSNDWQTALVPAFLKTTEAPHFPNTATVFSIHNLGYQGRAAAQQYQFLVDLGFPEDQFFRQDLNGLEFYGDLNLMKAGIVFSDKVTVVSKNYRNETLTAEFGEGLEGVLLSRGEDYVGVPNAAQKALWNPETLSDHPFSAQDLTNKAFHKDALRTEYGLEKRGNVPLVSIVSRLVEQKGMDLVAEKARAIVKDLDAQLIILGTGEKDIEASLRSLAEEFPDDVVFINDYDPPVSRKIFIGSDIFLVPSKYEPFGLTPLFAMSFGTIPVVRDTGGLHDSITDPDDAPGQSNGFKFHAADPEDFYRAVARAVNRYRKAPDAFQRMQQRAIQSVPEWSERVVEYEAVYQGALQKVRSEARAIFYPIGEGLAAAIDDKVSAVAEYIRHGKIVLRGEFDLEVHADQYAALKLEDLTAGQAYVQALRSRGNTLDTATFSVKEHLTVQDNHILIEKAPDYGDRLHIYRNRNAMGEAAAKRGIAKIVELFSRKRQTVRIVFAAAPSQVETIAALVRLSKGKFDWRKVEIFHMDEFSGFQPPHPVSFRTWINENLIEPIVEQHGIPRDQLNIHFIQADSRKKKDLQAEAVRYGQLLGEKPIDIVFGGYGYNGHVAFNDPPAKFAPNTNPVLVVDPSKDPVNARQQIEAYPDDFKTAADIPLAVTISIPAMADAQLLVMTVPGEVKAEAIKAIHSFEGRIENAPANRDVPGTFFNQLSADRIQVFTDVAGAQYLPRSEAREFEELDELEAHFRSLAKEARGKAALEALLFIRDAAGKVHQETVRLPLDQSIDERENLVTYLASLINVYGVLVGATETALNLASATADGSRNHLAVLSNRILDQVKETLDQEFGITNTMASFGKGIVFSKKAGLQSIGGTEPQRDDTPIDYDRGEAVGFDVGGTNLKVAYKKDGKLLFFEEIALTDIEKEAKQRDEAFDLGIFIERKINQLEEQFNTTLKDKPIYVVVPGPINPEMEIVTMVNLEQSRPGTLKSLHELRQRVPAVRFQNDGNTAVFNAIIQLGLGNENVAGNTLGTGIGGAIAVNGQLLPGPMEAHIRRKLTSTAVLHEGAGMQGDLESYSNAEFIVRRTRELAHSMDVSVREKLSPAVVAGWLSHQRFTPYRRIAERVFQEAGENLAVWYRQVARVTKINQWTLLQVGGIAQGKAIEQIHEGIHKGLEGSGMDYRLANLGEEAPEAGALGAVHLSIQEQQRSIRSEVRSIEIDTSLAKGLRLTPARRDRLKEIQHEWVRRLGAVKTAKKTGRHRLINETDGLQAWLLPHIDLGYALSPGIDLWDRSTRALNRHSVLNKIIATAKQVRGQGITDWVHVGVGGSAATTRALVMPVLGTGYEKLSVEQRKGRPLVHILGENFDPTYLRDTLRGIEGRGNLFKTVFNVVSKSGTTAEPVTAYMIIRNWLEIRLGQLARLYEENRIKETDLRSLGLTREDIIPLGTYPDGRLRYATGRFFVVTTGLPVIKNLEVDDVLIARLEEGTATDKEMASLDSELLRLHYSKTDEGRQDPFYEVLPVPEGMGGRFSTMSAVGLLTGAVVVPELGEEKEYVHTTIRAAVDAIEKYLIDLPADHPENVPFQTALAFYLWGNQIGKRAARTNLQLMDFAPQTLDVAGLMEELWNESVVERNQGPLLSKHLGTNENHKNVEGILGNPSPNIGWFFRTHVAPEDDFQLAPGLMTAKSLQAFEGHLQGETNQYAAAVGTAKDFAEKGIPAISWELAGRTAYDIAYLISTLQLTVAGFGDLRRLDALTYLQPHVVGYKAKTKSEIAKVVPQEYGQAAAPVGPTEPITLLLEAAARSEARESYEQAKSQLTALLLTSDDVPTLRRAVEGFIAADRERAREAYGAGNVPAMAESTRRETPENLFLTNAILKIVESADENLRPRHRVPLLEELEDVAPIGHQPTLERLETLLRERNFSAPVRGAIAQALYRLERNWIQTKEGLTLVLELTEDDENRGDFPDLNQAIQQAALGFGIPMARVEMPADTSFEVHSVDFAEYSAEIQNYIIYRAHQKGSDVEIQLTTVDEEGNRILDPADQNVRVYRNAKIAVMADDERLGIGGNVSERVQLEEIDAMRTQGDQHTAANSGNYAHTHVDFVIVGRDEDPSTAEPLMRVMGHIYELKGAGKVRVTALTSPREGEHVRNFRRWEYPKPSELDPKAVKHEQPRFKTFEPRAFDPLRFVYFQGEVQSDPDRFSHKTAQGIVRVREEEKRQRDVFFLRLDDYDDITARIYDLIEQLQAKGYEIEEAEIGGIGAFLGAAYDEGSSDSYREYILKGTIRTDSTGKPVVTVHVQAGDEDGSTDVGIMTRTAEGSQALSVNRALGEIAVTVTKKKLLNSRSKLLVSRSEARPNIQIVDVASVVESAPQLPPQAATDVWQAGVFGPKGTFSFFTTMTQFVRSSFLPAHTHPHVESFYVLSGTAEFLIGDKRTRLRAGHVVEIPRDVLHFVRVTSEEPFTILNIFPNEIVRNNALIETPEQTSRFDGFPLVKPFRIKVWDLFQPGKKSPQFNTIDYPITPYRHDAENAVTEFATDRDTVLYLARGSGTITLNSESTRQITASQAVLISPDQIVKIESDNLIFLAVKQRKDHVAAIRAEARFQLEYQTAPDEIVELGGRRWEFWNRGEDKPNMLVVLPLDPFAGVVDDILLNEDVNLYVLHRGDGLGTLDPDAELFFNRDMMELLNDPRTPAFHHIGTMVDVTFNEEVIKKLDENIRTKSPELVDAPRSISSGATGYDPIHYEVADSYGFQASFSPGLLTKPVQEHTLALLGNGFFRVRQRLTPANHSSRNPDSLEQVYWDQIRNGRNSGAHGVLEEITEQILVAEHMRRLAALDGLESYSLGKYETPDGEGGKWRNTSSTPRAPYRRMIGNDPAIQTQHTLGIVTGAAMGEGALRAAVALNVERILISENASGRLAPLVRELGITEKVLFVNLDTVVRSSDSVIRVPGAEPISSALFQKRTKGSVVTDPARIRVAQDEDERNKLFAESLRGQTLGIVGLGRIGFSVAKLAIQMRMNVVVNDILRDHPDHKAKFDEKLRILNELAQKNNVRPVEFMDLEDLVLNRSDIVSIHVAPKPEDVLFDAKLLKKMEGAKKLKVLINTSRGFVVQEEPLVELLRKRPDLTAELDVLESEKRLKEEGFEIENESPVLIAINEGLKNAGVYGHGASKIRRVRHRMFETMARAFVAVIRKLIPANALNRVWEKWVVPGNQIEIQPRDTLTEALERNPLPPIFYVEFPTDKATPEEKGRKILEIDTSNDDWKQITSRYHFTAPTQAQLYIPMPRSEARGSLAELFSTNSEFRLHGSAAEMADQVSVDDASRVLMVGLGKNPIHAAVFAAAGAQIDVVQPPVDLGENQTEILRRELEGQRQRILEVFDIDIEGRIDTDRFNTTVESADLPQRRYTHVLIHNVVETLGWLNIEGFIKPLLRAASDRSIFLISSHGTDMHMDVMDLFKRTATESGYDIEDKGYFFVSRDLNSEQDQFYAFQLSPARSEMRSNRQTRRWMLRTSVLAGTLGLTSGGYWLVNQFFGPSVTLERSIESKPVFDVLQGSLGIQVFSLRNGFNNKVTQREDGSLEIQFQIGQDDGGKYNPYSGAYLDIPEEDLFNYKAIEIQVAADSDPLEQLKVKLETLKGDELEWIARKRRVEPGTTVVFDFQGNRNPVLWLGEKPTVKRVTFPFEFRMGEFATQKEGTVRIQSVRLIPKREIPSRSELRVNKAVKVVGGLVAAAALLGGAFWAATQMPRQRAEIEPPPDQAATAESQAGPQPVQEAPAEPEETPAETPAAAKSPILDRALIYEAYQDINQGMRQMELTNGLPVNQVTSTTVSENGEGLWMKAGDLRYRWSSLIAMAAQHENYPVQAGDQVLSSPEYVTAAVKQSLKTYAALLNQYGLNHILPETLEYRGGQAVTKEEEVRGKPDQRGIAFASYDDALTKVELLRVREIFRGGMVAGLEDQEIVDLADEILKKTSYHVFIQNGRLYRQVYRTSDGQLVYPDGMVDNQNTEALLFLPLIAMGHLGNPAAPLEKRIEDGIQIWRDMFFKWTRTPVGDRIIPIRVGDAGGTAWTHLYPLPVDYQALTPDSIWIGQNNYLRAYDEKARIQGHQLTVSTAGTGKKADGYGQFGLFRPEVLVTAGPFHRLIVGDESAFSNVEKLIQLGKQTGGYHPGWGPVDAVSPVDGAPFSGNRKRVYMNLGLMVETMSFPARVALERKMPFYDIVAGELRRIDRQYPAIEEEAIVQRNLPAMDLIARSRNQRLTAFTSQDVYAYRSTNAVRHLPLGLIQIRYRLDDTNAYSGVYGDLLMPLDVTGYRTFRIRLGEQEDAVFPDRFKVELKISPSHEDVLYSAYTETPLGNNAVLEFDITGIGRPQTPIRQFVLTFERGEVGESNLEGTFSVRSVEVLSTAPGATEPQTPRAAEADTQDTPERAAQAAQIANTAPWTQEGYERVAATGDLEAGKIYVRRFYQISNEGDLSGFIPHFIWNVEGVPNTGLHQGPEHRLLEELQQQLDDASWARRRSEARSEFDTNGGFITGYYKLQLWQNEYLKRIQKLRLLRRVILKEGEPILVNGDSEDLSRIVEALLKARSNHEEFIFTYRLLANGDLIVRVGRHPDLRWTRGLDEQIVTTWKELEQWVNQKQSEEGIPQELQFSPQSFRNQIGIEPAKRIMDLTQGEDAIASGEQAGTVLRSRYQDSLTLDDSQEKAVRVIWMAVAGQYRRLTIQPLSRSEARLDSRQESNVTVAERSEARAVHEFDYKRWALVSVSLITRESSFFEGTEQKSSIFREPAQIQRALKQYFGRSSTVASSAFYNFLLNEHQAETNPFLGVSIPKTFDLSGLNGPYKIRIEKTGGLTPNAQDFYFVIAHSPQEGREQVVAVGTIQFYRSEARGEAESIIRGLQFGGKIGTVLVVEDQERQRNAHVKTLRGALEGVEIISARDGRGGIEESAQRKPDIIFTDVDMPGISGLQMVDEIRQSTGENIPAVVLSSLAPEQIQNSAFLSKTKSLKELSLTLVEIVKLVNADSSAARSEARSKANAFDIPLESRPFELQVDRSRSTERVPRPQTWDEAEAEVSASTVTVPRGTRSEARMLTLSRHRNEQIIIGDGKIVITVAEIQGDKVKLAVKADRRISVHREEIAQSGARIMMIDLDKAKIPAPEGYGLVITRRLDEKILIGDRITIMITAIRGDTVILGIEAPIEIPVHRKEVYEAKQRQDHGDGEATRSEARSKANAFDIPLESRPFELQVDRSRSTERVPRPQTWDEAEAEVSASTVTVPRGTRDEADSERSEARGELVESFEFGWQADSGETLFPIRQPKGEIGQWTEVFLDEGSQVEFKRFLEFGGLTRHAENFQAARLARAPITPDSQDVAAYTKRRKLGASSRSEARVQHWMTFRTDVQMALDQERFRDVFNRMRDHIQEERFRQIQERPVRSRFLAQVILSLFDATYARFSKGEKFWLLEILRKVGARSDASGLRRIVREKQRSYSSEVKEEVRATIEHLNRVPDRRSETRSEVGSPMLSIFSNDETFTTVGEAIHSEYPDLNWDRVEEILKNGDPIDPNKLDRHTFKGGDRIDIVFYKSPKRSEARSSNLRNKLIEASGFLRRDVKGVRISRAAGVAAVWTVKEMIFYEISEDGKNTALKSIRAMNARQGEGFGDRALTFSPDGRYFVLAKNHHLSHGPSFEPIDLLISKLSQLVLYQVDKIEAKIKIKQISKEDYSINGDYKLQRIRFGDDGSIKAHIKWSTFEGNPTAAHYGNAYEGTNVETLKKADSERSEARGLDDDPPHSLPGNFYEDSDRLIEERIAREKIQGAVRKMQELRKALPKGAGLDRIIETIDAIRAVHDRSTKTGFASVNQELHEARDKALKPVLAKQERALQAQQREEYKQAKTKVSGAVRKIKQIKAGLSPNATVEQINETIASIQLTKRTAWTGFSDLDLKLAQVSEEASDHLQDKRREALLRHAEQLATEIRAVGDRAGRYTHLDNAANKIAWAKRPALGTHEANRVVKAAYQEAAEKIAQERKRRDLEELEQIRSRVAELSEGLRRMAQNMPDYSAAYLKGAKRRIQTLAETASDQFEAETAGWEWYDSRVQAGIEIITAATQDALLALKSALKQKVNDQAVRFANQITRLSDSLDIDSDLGRAQKQLNRILARVEEAGIRLGQGRPRQDDGFELLRNARKELLGKIKKLQAQQDAIALPRAVDHVIAETSPDYVKYGDITQEDIDYLRELVNRLIEDQGIRGRESKKALRTVADAIATTLRIERQRKKQNARSEARTESVLSREQFLEEVFGRFESVSDMARMQIEAQIARVKVLFSGSVVTIIDTTTDGVIRFRFQEEIDIETLARILNEVNLIRLPQPLIVESAGIVPVTSLQEDLGTTEPIKFNLQPNRERLVETLTARQITRDGIGRIVDFDWLKQFVASGEREIVFETLQSFAAAARAVDEQNPVPLYAVPFSSHKEADAFNLDLVRLIEHRDLMRAHPHEVLRITNMLGLNQLIQRIVPEAGQTLEQAVATYSKANPGTVSLMQSFVDVESDVRIVLSEKAVGQDKSFVELATTTLLERTITLLGIKDPALRDATLLKDTNLALQRITESGVSYLAMTTLRNLVAQARAEARIAIAA